METIPLRGDLEMVTPKKSQHPDQTTPRRSERKRALFPTSSPQTSDLGHMSPLGSSPDRFSSAPVSPSSSNLSPVQPTRIPASPFGRKSTSALHVTCHVSPRKRFSELFGRNLETALKTKVTSYRSQEIVPVDQLEQTVLSVMDESDCGDSPHSCMSQRTPGATPDGLDPTKVVCEMKSYQPITPSKRRSMPASSSGSTTSSSPQSPKRGHSLDAGSKSAELPRARTSLFSDRGHFTGIKRARDDGIYLTGRSAKRQKIFGEINGGVRTGIRRPPKVRPKKVSTSSKRKGKVTTIWDVAPTSSVKKQKSPVGIKLPHIPKMSLASKPTRSPQEQAAFSASAALRVHGRGNGVDKSDEDSIEEGETLHSPEPDPTRRFFKRNERNRKAFITVNKNVRIQVIDGRYTLDRSGNTPGCKKKRKLFNRAEQIESINMFDDKQEEDVADSTRNDVQNILRTLEEEKEESPPRGQVTAVSVEVSETPVISPSKAMPLPTSSVQPTRTCLSSVVPYLETKQPELTLRQSRFTPTALQPHSPPRQAAESAASAGLLSPLSELASSTSTLSLNIGGESIRLNAAQVKALSAVPDIMMEEDQETTSEILAEPLAPEDFEQGTTMFPSSPQACKENKSSLANTKDSAEKKLFPIFHSSHQLLQSGHTVVMERERKRKRAVWRPIGDDQYQIDAGQKRFGATQCGECGLVYQLGDPDDEIKHLEHHNSGNVLRYLGWKKERVVGELGGNRVILVKPGDPKVWWTKVMEVLQVVDKDLGFTNTGTRSPEQSKVFLYISDKRIVGCLVAEPIKTAFRMLPCEAETSVDCCSVEEYHVKCGVSRIWVHSLSRRRHIATELMDCMRKNMIYGSILSLDEIAFSSPSVSGKQFAEHYTGRKDFCVYT